MLRQTNDPEIATAVEWVGELDTWISTHGLCGYDPFDVKQHPWIRAAQPNAFTRKTTTAVCDLFPDTVRKLLHVEPTENPKAHALVALGALRLHEATGDAEHLEHALARLGWLRANSLEGFSGLCWGYPFDVFGKGVDTPKGTPIGVVSAIAGEAFLAAYTICGEDTLLEAVRSICDFILKDLPRLEAEDGTFCFAYTPTDTRRVHNMNLLAVAILMRCADVTGDDSLRNAAEPALQFTLSRQREDGAWAYGDVGPDKDHDPELLKLVDHHHTGFVLRSLNDILSVGQNNDVENGLKKGYAYYRKNLIRKNGMPINAYGAYPVDIHACAEAILCHASLAPRFGPAIRHATAAMKWSYYHLRERSSGAVYHRAYPFHTSRLVCPRWGIAWMYRALAEYVYQRRELL